MHTYNDKLFLRRRSKLGDFRIEKNSNFDSGAWVSNFCEPEVFGILEKTCVMDGDDSR